MKKKARTKKPHLKNNEKTTGEPPQQWFARFVIYPTIQATIKKELVYLFQEKPTSLIKRLFCY